MDNHARQMIAARPGIGATGHITQASRQGFTSLTTDRPMIIIVRRGRKIIRSGRQCFVLEAGEAIAIGRGHVVDFENIPAEDGDYEARWLTLDAELVEAFGEPLNAEHVTTARLLGRMSKELSDAFEAAVLALSNDEGLPEAIVRHRVTELLAWLGASGSCFSPKESSSYAIRVRAIIARKPAHGWSSAQICAMLGISEATLRRRLQSEGARLRDLLTDVRMTHAMNLLQSSRLPVSAVAARSGFESQSRFAIRFRSRFGFAPTALRGHSRMGQSFPAASDQAVKSSSA